jgi:sporulation protein YlmC with PRC-barrel domain
MAAHYGTLGTYRFSETPTEDVRGSSVYGVDDEKLGKIDDVVFDHNTGNIRYAVIDTGGWLSSKKFIVPADRLSLSQKHKDDFQVPLTKQQIENFPPYEEKDVKEEDRWKDYEKRYEKAWTDGPVQHRKGTDHNITPTVTEMPPAPVTGSSARNVEPIRGPERIIPATGNEVTDNVSAAGIGGRWSTFESRLRERRRHITTGCTSCTIGSAEDREESVADERKAV